MNTKYVLIGLGAASAVALVYKLLKVADGEKEIVFEVPAPELHRLREEQFTKFALFQATAEEIKQLPALFFPNNPRIAALMRRYIDRRTSIGENIRMSGWICFPDNPRAAELVRRNILGLNNSAARRELQDYWTKIDQLEEELEGLQESLYGTDRPHIGANGPFFDREDPDYRPWPNDEYIQPRVTRRNVWISDSHNRFSVYAHELHLEEERMTLEDFGSMGSFNFEFTDFGDYSGLKSGRVSDLLRQVLN